MWRSVVSVALAVLLAGGHALETQDCAHGDEQCVIGADHALLATKVQMDRSRGAIEAQPVPPVSMTMKCVIAVTVLYFVMFTSLFVVSTAQEFSGGDTYDSMKQTLEGACETVRYAPMISVLFIGTRMRAIAVTKGDPELYGLPQWWCKDAMAVSACCVFALTFCSILEKVVPGMAGILTIVQYLADALLYAGFAVVAFGLYSMDTPPALGASTPVSDTAKCVMYLTLFYFFVAILLQLGVTYDLFTKKGSGKTETTPLTEGTGKSEEKSGFTNVMHHALEALNFAPQICVLFLGARMRALQLGHSDPQPWALYFFFAATYALMLYSIFIAIQHATGGASTALTILETISLMVIHVSTVAVIASVFTIVAVTGPTPFISTTVRVIMGMTVLYFFVHTLLFVCEQMSEKKMVAENTAAWTVAMFMEARDTVMFVPMMCALFLGTRMRALQLSRNQGAPQGWAQDFMMLANWAMFIYLATVLATHCFSSGEKGEKHFVSRVIEVIMLATMHISVSAIIVSIFLQTVENTMVNGADTLIPGFKIPGRA